MLLRYVRLISDVEKVYHEHWHNAAQQRMLQSPHHPERSAMFTFTHSSTSVVSTYGATVALGTSLSVLCALCGKKCAKNIHRRIWRYVAPGTSRGLLGVLCGKKRREYYLRYTGEFIVNYGRGHYVDAY